MRTQNFLILKPTFLPPPWSLHQTVTSSSVSPAAEPSSKWDGGGTCLVVQWFRRYRSACVIPGWGAKWQPTPVFLPEKSCGQRSLVGYSPWGRKESDTTGQLHFHFLSWGTCSQTFLKLRWGHEAYTHCGSDSKESACSARDPGLIPGSGRSPGEGNGNPLQYPCLENSIDWGAWLATDHGVAESDTTEQLHFTNIINTSHSLSSFLTSNSQSVVLHPFYYHEYLKANPRYHVVSTENVLLQRRLWSHKLCSGMSSC